MAPCSTNGGVFGNYSVSSSIGQNIVIAETDVETEMALSELMVYFERQLAGLDWQRVSTEQTDVAVWSSWKFVDERGKEWIGTLFIMQSPVSSQTKRVTLRADRILE